MITGTLENHDRVVWGLGISGVGPQVGGRPGLKREPIMPFVGHSSHVCATSGSTGSKVVQIRPYQRYSNPKPLVITHDRQIYCALQEPSEISKS